ncbi:MAG TPA: sporulation-delaying protein SdpB family protein [Lentzea sp.]
MLTRLGLLLTRLTDRTPFTNVVGLARALLAVATLTTLLFDSTDSLFVGLHSGGGVQPTCDGVGAFGAFCLGVPLEVVRWSAIAVLVAVIAGFRPQWTCIPHWYVAFSYQVNATVVDGGDQLAAVVTVLLIPLCLVDTRRSHWRNEEDVPGVAYGRRLVAQLSLVLVQVQVAVLYFDAGIAKLGTREWADGSAMYYWMGDPTFGAPQWQQWLFRPILTTGITVTLFTWVVLFGEVALAFGVLVPWRHRKPFLYASVVFHLGIALMMGLVSFALTMIAADLLAYHDARVPLRGRRRPDTASIPEVLEKQDHEPVAVGAK